VTQSVAISEKIFSYTDGLFLYSLTVFTSIAKKIKIFLRTPSSS
jgi:hypothetical protein